MFVHGGVILLGLFKRSCLSPYKYPVDQPSLAKLKRGLKRRKSSGKEVGKGKKKNDKASGKKTCARGEIRKGVKSEEKKMARRGMKRSERKTGTHIGLIFILNCISSAWMCCSRKKKKKQPETFSCETLRDSFSAELLAFSRYFNK